MLSMFDAQFHFAFRRGIGLERVSDHDARRFDGACQKLRQDAARGVGVSSLLDKNVENETILVHRAPEPVSFASNRNDGLVEMPFVPAQGSSLTDLIGKLAPELARPLAHRLIAHANSPRCEHFFDHAKAQGKPEIEPDRCADDFRRKPMTAIKRGRAFDMARTYPTFAQNPLI